MMLAELMKKAKQNLTIRPKLAADIALDLQKQITLLEQQDFASQDWVASIIESLQLKKLEIEALTASQDIGGWLSGKEAAELFRLSSFSPHENAVCCELGSWLGKSTVILGKALKIKNNAQLYAIDPFNLVAHEPWHQQTFFEQVGDTSLSRREVVEETMRQHDLDDVVTLVESFSEDAVQNFDQQIDLLFIDADHRYESVIRDYRNWSPFIKPGGFIAFHDYHREGGAHDGPRRVVHECIVNSPEWKVQWLVDTLYIAQKNE